jgi:hypothetical protein
MARVWEWQLGDGTRVAATARAFGGITLQVNGEQLTRVRAAMKMQCELLPLPHMAAALHYGSPMGVGFRCELRVDGKLVLPTTAPKGFAKQLTACPNCQAALQRDARFCDACGQPIPSAEQLTKQSEAAQGNGAIGGLSLLFLLSGFAMYGVQRSAANQALRDIAGHDASAPLAQPIPGVAATTIGELREAIEWEANSVLVVNLLLAAIMCGLWLWGKRKPGPAIIIAFCTYVVVLVVNAALDPKTLAQGWLVKFIVIVYLVRGLKAALAVRSSTPSPA